MKENNSHQVTESWEGWYKSRKAIGRDTNEDITQFGLEMQCPYAEHLLDGRKVIETRGYSLPSALLTDISCSRSSPVRISILESKAGKDGVSSIPDQVEVLTNEQSKNDGPTHPFLIRKGWCTFIESFRYRSREQFEADEHKHLVPPTSGYGWDGTRPIYGWVVGTCGYYPADGTDEHFHAKRRMRSLFEIQRN